MHEILPLDAQWVLCPKILPLDAQGVLCTTTVIPAKAGASADGTSIQKGRATGKRHKSPPKSSPLMPNGCVAHKTSPLMPKGCNGQILPLDAQGGTKGGLDSTILQITPKAPKTYPRRETPHYATLKNSRSPNVPADAPAGAQTQQQPRTRHQPSLSRQPRA